jgi:hypothetical protein
MSKAIITRYLGPTNTKPSRIRAGAEGVPSKIWSCEELRHPTKSAYVLAAQKFAARNSWPTSLASGQLPNGDWVHCFIPVEVPTPRETTEVRAQIKHGTQKEALEQPYQQLDGVAPKTPDPNNYHVAAVSSNTNSFGYKSVLALNAHGLAVQLLVQAYGTDKVPEVGDVVTLGESRWYGAPVRLPSVTPEKAAKIIKTLTK